MLTLRFPEEGGLGNPEFGLEVSIVWPRIVPPKIRTQVLPMIRPLVELINNLSLIAWLNFSSLFHHSILREWIIEEIQHLILWFRLYILDSYLIRKKDIVTLSKYYFISATSFRLIKLEINFTPSTFLTLNLKHQLCTKKKNLKHQFKNNSSLATHVACRKSNMLSLSINPEGHSMEQEDAK